MKPMLAYTIEDTSNLPYPVLCSVKLDGIRMLIVDGVCMSRSMKPIRSRAVQELFGKPEYNGLDGELLYGDWNAPNVFNVTTSAVMATELKPEFSRDKIAYAVFDVYNDPRGNQARANATFNAVWNTEDNSQVQLVGSKLVDNEDDLLAYEQKCLDDGYEGIMVRNLDGKYKQGRSTIKEGTIGKLKRMSQDEGLIVGFEEKMTNTNPAYENELGRTQRSQDQAGMVGANTLGAFILECQGIRFTCGSGLDGATRKEIWENREDYIGKYVTFTHFAIGRVESFRFPIYKGIRDIEDMS